MTLEFLFGSLENRPIENPRISQADFFERLQHDVFFEFLHAFESNRGNRGTFNHADDQHSPFGFNADVLEKSGRKKRTNGFRYLFGVDCFADLDGQVGKNRARLGALQTFDADILDDERPERGRFMLLGISRRHSRDQGQTTDEAGQESGLQQMESDQVSVFPGHPFTS